MKVEFLKKFYDDLDDINNKSVKQAIIRVILGWEMQIPSQKFPILKS